MPVSIEVSFEVRTGTEPTVPEARRGHVTEGPIRETREQLDGGLVWIRCSFCGKYVLVGARSHTRERCSCGARRCYLTDSRRGVYQEGWRKGNDAWWMC